MTYIVGFRQPGMNTIISDSRGTWKRVDGTRYGDNNALKTGLLFPGCIYGMVGNATRAGEFILTFKQSIGRERDARLLWSLFQDIVRSYSFPQEQDDRFKILLSVRSTGEPVFHLLDSKSGISTPDIEAPYVIKSYGSGRRVLDRYIAAMSRSSLKGLQHHLLAERELPEKAVHEISPYFLCLWLSELSLTAEGAYLAKHGVGGVFHFIYQTSDMESKQRPAVYIFSAADRRSMNISSWMYRVAYARGGLYIERSPLRNESRPSSRRPQVEEYLLFNTAASPGVDRLDPATLYEQVARELEAQPFWFFCGIGHTIDSDRGCHFFNASYEGKREDIIGSDGALAPQLRKVIENGFSGERLPWVSDLAFE